MRRLLISVALVLVVVVVPILLLAANQTPREYYEDFESRAATGASWQVDAGDNCAIELSDSMARNGTNSLRFEAGRDARCEVIPVMYSPLLRKLFREPFGRTRRYAFSTRLEIPPDETQEAPSLDSNLVVAQWHSSPDPLLGGEPGRGPSLALRVHNGRWGVTYGWDARFLSDAGYRANNWHWIGRVKAGEWDAWEFDVRWAWDDSGFIEVRKNGELVFRREGPNAYNDLRGVYLKLGLYHPVSPQVLFVDDVAISNLNAEP